MQNSERLKGIKGAIFDLDGVLVDTAKYHYKAWKKLASELGFEFTEKDNERLKGVSRLESLDILLEIGGFHMSEDLKNALAQVKNDWYVQLISKIREDEMLRGAREYLEKLKKQGVKIALGSASKNSGIILKALNIESLFDEIVDGTMITKSKPDPQIFLLGAKKLGLSPSDCAVYEDSLAGIKAAKKAGSLAVGIGSQSNLPIADFVVAGLYELL
jgi:beta-phosphoglucomutase